MLSRICLGLAVLAGTTLSNVAPPAVPAVGPLLGPPLICHPIDIAGGKSLPWGDGGKFEGDRTYDVKFVSKDTLEVLNGSHDTLVHMETIRRAVIYIVGFGPTANPGEAWGDAEARWLVLSLKERLVDAQLQATKAGKSSQAMREVALAWFDVGYAIAALEQADHRHESEAGIDYLEHAIALDAGDGAMHLGAAIAGYGHGRPDKSAMQHIDRVVALADDPDGLLRKNLLGTIGTFSGKRTYDDMASWVRDELDQA